ncbi:sushi, von Willebrand factor type A, EGF and pentraxin domain-containing protein 1-like [Stegodyphus dumicola]|uniref:sushi, von Willebrand factor type A, EGF and pentraxin domain-containing protein 1-like n=1 Tax=Stegodyphus dumicola TaxID=202533 RepID=UPI0015A75C0D|nr:sushi, von Willebrand factor type A, EGF and pentraxin domain-containing protein 1-like [Stegodyphus dumicola]
MNIVLVYFVVIGGSLVSVGVKADINCGPPPLVRRAIIIAGANKEVYRPESLVLYKCQLGYSSDVTVFSSKCKLSGNIATWTRPTIRCKRVTCIVPGSPKNGRAIYSSINYEAEVTYECNEGYYLSNQERRFCSADGTWNGTDPVCSDNLCSLPRAPENGFFNLKSLKPEIGSTVEYSCKDGFKLEGFATSECTETRRWTNSIPRCLRLPKMCEPPVAPENGFFNLTPDKPEAGSVVKYSCRYKYRLHGSATSECSGEGTWTNPTPRCFFITDSCKVPVLPHGEIGMYKIVPHPQYSFFLKYENISAGTIVPDGQYVLKCEGRYKPKGSGGQEKRIECKDGTWLDELQCVSENSCELPVIPQNGFYRAPENVEFGSVIKYFCKDGFSLQGFSESICRTPGTWSHPTPTCLTLTELFEEEGNKARTTQPSIRSSTEGTINENGMNPDNKLCYCEYNSPNEHLVAYCEYIKLHNGDKVKFNCTVKFFCKEAEYYRLRGPREMTCTNCQPFRSTQYPKCMERNRREPCFMETLFSRLPEGVMLKTEERQPETVPYGTSLELTCARNDERMMHITSYRNMAICNGTWIVPPVRCNRPCRLTLKANSSLIALPKKDLYLYGETVALSCPKGQALTPDIRIMFCFRRGWSRRRIPDCEER